MVVWEIAQSIHDTLVFLQIQCPQAVVSAKTVLLMYTVLVELAMAGVLVKLPV